MEIGAYDWNSFIHLFEGRSMPSEWQGAYTNSFNKAMQMNSNWIKAGYSPVSTLDYLWYNIGFKFNIGY